MTAGNTASNAGAAEAPVSPGTEAMFSKRLSPECRSALERVVARARAKWRSRAKARGSDAALDSDEVECQRRLHLAPALYQTVQAMLDADQCVPEVVVRIENAPRGEAPGAAWKTAEPVPSWYGHVFHSAMPVVAPPLLQRTHRGLTAFVSAKKEDLPALEKVVDACLR